MKKIIIVDDHPILLLAIKVLLKERSFSVVAEAENGVKALKEIKKHQPDIAIIDLNIPLLDGISVIEKCKKHELKTKFLVLTSQPSSHFVSRAIQAGASGYISKDEGLENILTAVNSISSGYSFFPDKFKNVSSKDQITHLSSKELVVFKYLSEGLSNKEIGEKMLISNKTVSTYKTRIMEKLNIKNIAELIELSKREGL
ncbi:Virulence factors putative positive transcription regulator BvgA [Vibrio alginolyticus]|uniref:Virulence factors putative positive transcription regulator BvgA n=1 Tax=Vibrio alginolyticus TaxID=663 RepID=A0A1W6TCY7_VIBAL|nr:response regulator transcription factor [Vibrio alginolyticus]MBE4296061.1 response regulator transcription factor [Vibrio parahaemolyticus]ARO98831.1 Virulence factors putative positive transcription regulator BvgA [Vibrio alginolyticus]ARP03547.1 Virulence factors putative positive transcription regulator BvgA [Vibrio alginolyticus]ARP08607.1 Virulence factors putative positive transcription regulator BvgA [Vibrio alginolyticus]ARP13682.1 Virulence factors putative positive transcription 